MANWRQNTLPGVTRSDNKNKGKEFEACLEAAHDFYRIQGLIDVVRNAETWVCIDKLKKEQRAEDVLQHVYKNSPVIAINGQGWIYKKQNSDVDFSGGNGSIAVVFDAKECGEDVFPLKYLKTHQITRLKQSAKCRTIAGFMIWFYRLDRVFFAPIAFVAKKEEIWLRQAARAKAGTASISLEEFETHCVEVFKNKRGAFWDWFTYVCQPKLPENK